MYHILFLGHIFLYVSCGFDASFFVVCREAGTDLLVKQDLSLGELTDKCNQNAVYKCVYNALHL